jgi:hypothetical protein
MTILASARPMTAISDSFVGVRVTRAATIRCEADFSSLLPRLSAAAKRTLQSVRTFAVCKLLYRSDLMIGRANARWNG